MMQSLCGRRCGMVEKTVLCTSPARKRIEHPLYIASLQSIAPLTTQLESLLRIIHPHDVCPAKCDVDVNALSDVGWGVGVNIWGRNWHF